MEQNIIDKINNECPYNQGIYFQPNYIPVKIKELVVYSRYKTGGYSGGSCWDDSNPQPYSSDIPNDHMKVLDLVLAEICPNISYLNYKKIQSIVHDNEETEYEYYGNSTDWKVEYIILSELENLVKTF